MKNIVPQNTFFKTFGLSYAFLNKLFEDWPQEESFCVDKSVNNAKFFNYISYVFMFFKREAKLLKNYSKLITNDEEQKQYLLQVVSK